MLALSTQAHFTTDRKHNALLQGEEQILLRALIILGEPQQSLSSSLNINRQQKANAEINMLGKDGIKVYES